MTSGAGLTRSKLRWSIPVGIAAAAVGASVALPAFSAGADAALPKVSAQQLLSRTLSSDVDTLSGTVRTHSDLGIPALPSDVRSSDLSSLITGDGTLRVAKSGEDKQRLSVLGSQSERTFVHNGRTAWSYDSSERKAVRTTLPADAGSHKSRGKAVSPDDAAKRILGEVGKDSEVSVGRAAEVAGRDAYLLVVKPKSAESLIGSVQVPVDAHLRPAVPQHDGHDDEPEHPQRRQQPAHPRPQHLGRGRPFQRRRGQRPGEREHDPPSNGRRC